MRMYAFLGIVYLLILQSVVRCKYFSSTFQLFFLFFSLSSQNLAHYSHRQNSFLIALSSVSTSWHLVLVFAVFNRCNRYLVCVAMKLCPRNLFSVFHVLFPFYLFRKFPSCFDIAFVTVFRTVITYTNLILWHSFRPLFNKRWK